MFEEAPRKRLTEPHEYLLSGIELGELRRQDAKQARKLRCVRRLLRGRKYIAQRCVFLVPHEVPAICFSAHTAIALMKECPVHLHCRKVGQRFTGKWVLTEEFTFLESEFQALIQELTERLASSEEGDEVLAPEMHGGDAA